MLFNVRLAGTEESTQELDLSSSILQSSHSCQEGLKEAGTKGVDVKEVTCNRVTTSRISPHDWGGSGEPCLNFLLRFPEIIHKDFLVASNTSSWGWF